jgi:hypothetical protein
MCSCLFQIHPLITESVKEILWSEGLWLGEELKEAWENYFEVQGYSPLVC